VASPADPSPDVPPSSALVAQHDAASLKAFSTLLGQLHCLTTRAHDSAEVLLQDVVETGCQLFGLSTGLVSRVEGNDVTIRVVVSAHDHFEAGAHFDLKDTYCRWVVEAEGIVAHATAEAATGHPANRAPRMAAYIGAPIWVNGAIYGTLSFSDLQPRVRAFTPEERDILGTMARSIGRFLEHTSAHEVCRQAEENLQRSEVVLRQANQMAQVGGWEYVPSTGQLYWTEEVYRLHELPLDHEPQVEKALQHYAPEARPVLTCAVQQALNEGTCYDLELPFFTETGTLRWVRVLGEPVTDTDGTLLLVGAIQDITRRVCDRARRQEAQHRLQQLEQEYEAVFENAQDALFFVDVHRSNGPRAEEGYRFTYARLNPSYQAKAGFSEDEVRGKTPREVLGDEVGAQVEAQYRQCVEEAATTEYEETLMLPSGTRLWHAKLSPVVFDGTVTHIVGIARDITKHKALRDQLHYQAHHDPLTELPNRKQFFKRCQDAIDAYEAHGTPYTVLFLDLDRFKNVNDSLGHQVGDALLQTIARRIEERLRRSDFVGRLGGDEFGFVLESTGAPEDIEQVARRISDAIEEPFHLEGQTIRIDVSIGIVIGEARHHTPEDLLREADMAMYRAKSQSDGWTFFDPNLGKHIRTQFFLEADLHRAIQEDELCVFYQPLVDMTTGALAGFESLVRWQHPEQGLLTPGHFIEVAERTGLVADLDRWMIEATCRQAHAWQAVTDCALIFHVNCSRRTFIDGPLVEHIDRVLAETGLPPAQLALEITERMVVENTNAVAREMDVFRERGVRLCIDDFGVKYSSLSVLHQLPVDVIKVDRKFVQQIDGSEANPGFVRAIADLAHGMGLSLVAEGIETPRQLKGTRDLGYQLGQGFLMARPMDVEAATACLQGDMPWMKHWTDATPPDEATDS